MELKGNKLTLLHRGIRQKRGWVSINNNGFIYISRDKNRLLGWILSKIEKKKDQEFLLMITNNRYPCPLTNLLFGAGVIIKQQKIY